MCIYTYNRMMNPQGVPTARYSILNNGSTNQMSLWDMVSGGSVIN